jgi:hypothetical protein
MYININANFQRGILQDVLHSLQITYIPQPSPITLIHPPHNMTDINEAQELVPVAAAVTDESKSDAVEKPEPNQTDTSTDAAASAAITPIDKHWDQTSKKVVVHNVLKFIRPNEISKLTSSWTKDTDIVIVKTKKPPKENWIKVTLETEDMVDQFIKLINEGGDDGNAMKNSRGGNMFAKRALDMDDRDNKKRGRDNDDDEISNGRDAKRAAVVSKVLSNDEVRDAITPLWRKSYEEQLDLKAKEMVNKCSKNIIKEIKKKFR